MSKVLDKDGNLVVKTQNRVAIKNKFNEVESCLIEAYGEPKEGIIHGKPFRFINSHLDSFRDAFKDFSALMTQYDLNPTDYPNEMILILDYCKQDDYLRFATLVKQIKKKADVNSVLIKILLNLKLLNERDRDIEKVQRCISDALSISAAKSSFADLETVNHYDSRLEVIDEILHVQDVTNKI